MLTDTSAATFDVAVSSLDFEGLVSTKSSRGGRCTWQTLAVGLQDGEGFLKTSAAPERPLSSHSRFSGTAVFSLLLVNTCRAGPAGGGHTRLLHAQQLRLGPCPCEWELAVLPRPGGGSGRECCGSSFQRAGWEQPEKVWATCCLERCPHPSLPDCKILGTQEPNFCWVIMCGPGNGAGEAGPLGRASLRRFPGGGGGGEKRLWARAWRADREPLWGVGRKAPLQPAGLPEEVTPSLPAQSPSSPRPGHGQGRPSAKSKLTPPTTPESAPASGVHRPSPNQAPGERLGRQSDQAGQ